MPGTHSGARRRRYDDAASDDGAASYGLSYYGAPGYDDPYGHDDPYGQTRRSRPRRASRTGLSGWTATQVRRTGVATAVVSTLGIAMVQTTGVAHSQPSESYTQADATGLTASPSVATGGTDSLSDPALATSKPLTLEQVANTRAQQDVMDRDTALAELMVTMQQRRVSEAFAEAARKEAARWVRPDIGRLTQAFGGASGHPGIDLGGPFGSDIAAAHAGTVIYAGWETGYGYFVQIEHAGNVVTCYGHLSQLLVSVGQQVTTGQIIGREGSTGESTGPHLHFEVRIGGQNGTKVDPIVWLANHGVDI